MNDINTRSVYMLSLQAADIFCANNLIADEGKNSKEITGYSTKNLNGRGFISQKYNGSFDYSLDLVKIKEVCDKKHIKFFLMKNAKQKKDKKEYTDIIINVDFDYNVKEFNKSGYIYSRFGYQFTYKNFETIETVSDKGKKYNILDTGVVLNAEGELLGIMLYKQIKNPVSSDVLGKYFIYDEKYKYYKVNKNIPTMICDNNRWDCRNLRQHLYNNGFYSNGKHYVRYKRSAGSSRVGKCLFIDDRIYKELHKYDLCGLEIKDTDKTDLAAFESYIALTNSSNIDTINIKKENILVIADYHSIFNEEVIAVWNNDNCELEADKKIVQIDNNIWDGQSLIDPSIMGKYQDKGMILLRNRFFKSCCFSCSISKFFDKHKICSIEQLNGFTLATDIKDIKLITTESSIKLTKFTSLDDWFNNLIETFGIVKYEKPTPYFDGNLVQMSYQMFNCLQASKVDIPSLLEPTVNFMKALRDDHEAVKYFINFANDTFYDETEDKEEIDINSKNDLIFKLLETNCDFHKSKMYHDFKRSLITSFVKRAKRGNILVKGTYATVCGNPIEMLYHSILDNNGKSRFENNNFESTIAVNNIYCKKFDFDKKLFSARNPYITMGNAGLPINVDNKLIEEYMNPTNEIVFINSINENVLQRNNGMDMDSDQLALIDESQIIDLVEKNYSKFLVPTSLVDGDKKSKEYTKNNLSDLDSSISKSKRIIGEIVNLSQQLNSELWNGLNNDPCYDYETIYKDICRLAILSGLAIDSAKKKFPVNISSELETIRKRLNDLYKDELEILNEYKEKKDYITSIKPKFLSTITKHNGHNPSSKTLYREFDTAMDYLQSYLSKVSRGFTSVGQRNRLKMKDLIIDDKYQNSEENRHRIETIINLVNDTKKNIGTIWRSLGTNQASKRGLINWYRKNLSDEIGKKELNQSTVIGLLRRSDTIGDNNNLLLQALLDIPEINILQYFICKDDQKSESEKAANWEEKKSEIFSIFSLTLDS